VPPDNEFRRKLIGYKQHLADTLSKSCVSFSGSSTEASSCVGASSHGETSKNVPSFPLSKTVIFEDIVKWVMGSTESTETARGLN